MTSPKNNPAVYLIFASLLIYILNTSFHTSKFIASFFINIAMYAVIYTTCAVLLMWKQTWAIYVFALITIYILLQVLLNIQNFTLTPVFFVVVLAQTVFQIAAVIVFFKNKNAGTIN